MMMYERFQFKGVFGFVCLMIVRWDCIFKSGNVGWVTNMDVYGYAWIGGVCFVLLLCAFHRHSRVGGPFTGTRTMKNEVLLRYKRARWHSVIGDSSIHRAWTAAAVIPA